MKKVSKNVTKQNEPDKTHFGFQQVPTKEKTKRVADIFHSVANKYDLMNDLMSFGIHRLWKQITIFIANIKPNAKVLDLASGTGDLAALMAKKIGGNGQIILSDINSSMLNIARNRMLDKGLSNNATYILADAENLPFPKNYFDTITIAFGLRNVTQKDKALKAMYSVLKPGGKVYILEFSKPTIPIVNSIYDRYSFHILPKLGQWVANDANSYQYLAESIRMHPDQETLRTLLETAGFEDCQYNNFNTGIVALHSGCKY